MINHVLANLSASTFQDMEKVDKIQKSVDEVNRVADFFISRDNNKASDLKDLDLEKGRVMMNTYGPYKSFYENTLFTGSVKYRADSENQEVADLEVRRVFDNARQLDIFKYHDTEDEKKMEHLSVFRGQCGGLDIRNRGFVENKKNGTITLICDDCADKDMKIRI